MLNWQESLAHESRRPEPVLGGSGGMFPWQLLKYRPSKMHFPAFGEGNFKILSLSFCWHKLLFFALPCTMG